MPSLRVSADARVSFASSFFAIAAPQPPLEAYSYREDLRDLIGSGWRLRAVVFAIALVLLASVAGVYFEVHRYVTDQISEHGKVTKPNVKVLSSASPTANVVATLAQNTRLRILKHESGDWLQVEVEPPTATIASTSRSAASLCPRSRFALARSTYDSGN